MYYNYFIFDSKNGYIFDLYQTFVDNILKKDEMFKKT